MAHDRTEPAFWHLLVVGLAAIPAIYFLVVTTFSISGLVNSNGNVAGEDFAQIWLGGRLAIEDRVHEIFVPEHFKAAARAAFAAPNVPAIFSYPPTTLLPAVALAIVPYPVALALWSAIQVVLFTTALVLATRRFLSPGLAVVVALTSPSLALTLPWGQFGAIIAALMALGVLLLDRRPVLAGVLLGLMVVKPQFGVFIPIALAVGRHRHAFAAASVTVATAVLLTLLLFGTGAWIDFVNVTMPAQIAITSDPHNYLPIAHSVRDRLVIMGVDPSAARTVQVLAACVGLAAVALVFTRRAPPATRLFVLAAATEAALPYVALYDQAVVSLAALVLVAARPSLDRLTQTLLMVLWASPILDLWLTMSDQPQISPFVGPMAMIVVAVAESRQPTQAGQSSGPARVSPALHRSA
jgi:hypothetical protein